MKRLCACVLPILILSLSACAFGGPELPQELPQAAAEVRTLPEPEPAQEPNSFSRASENREAPSVPSEPAQHQAVSRSADEPKETPEAAGSVLLFVGSRNSEVYHLADCTQAGRIREDNSIGWETADEAEADGKRPCRICCPEAEGEAIIALHAENDGVTDSEERSGSDCPAVELAYVGSVLSDKYHRPSCRYAKEIENGNLIGWESCDAAERDGYQPCKVCKPN